MTISNEPGIEGWTDKPATVPDQFSVSIRNFNSEEQATSFGHLIGEYIRQISRVIDLSHLDGVTVAGDYAQALLDLDRGYATSHKLTPSTEHAVGVAMTPAVIRDGTIKSHIVLAAEMILPLSTPEHEEFSTAFHMLVHECAHVELNHFFDAAFPGRTLQKPLEALHQGLRWQVISACWDEYGATWISANFGAEQTDNYEETFILVLNATRAKANDHIKEFRVHGNVEQIAGEVYGAYGGLMKFASYHLGNLAGRGLSVCERPETILALQDHWFSPFFERLESLLKALASNHGKWTSLDEFEAIGDLADELVAMGGLTISSLPDGSGYVNVPFSDDTMP